MTASTTLETTNFVAFKQSQRGTFSYENVQFAIEQLYDTRPKVLRIALMGTLLHRPDPQNRETDAERQENRDLLKSETQELTQVTAMLQTGTPACGIHPQLAKWMSVLAHENPSHLSVIEKVTALSQRILEAALTGGPDQNVAINEHRRVARASFHTAVTELCLFMWRDYDKDQSLRLKQTHTAANVLSERLNRLERIGTHVRLVSLNATVEASHLGDAGRGLSLIAQEFKGLAEEVTKLARTAREDVDVMLKLE